MTVYILKLESFKPDEETREILSKINGNKSKFIKDAIKFYHKTSLNPERKEHPKAKVEVINR